MERERERERNGHPDTERLSPLIFLIPDHLSIANFQSCQLINLNNLNYIEKASGTRVCRLLESQ